jgi:hypothetical protein
MAVSRRCKILTKRSLEKDRGWVTPAFFQQDYAGLPLSTVAVTCQLYVLATEVQR